MSIVEIRILAPQNNFINNFIVLTFLNELWIFAVEYLLEYAMRFLWCWVYDTNTVLRLRIYEIS